MTSSSPAPGFAALGLISIALILGGCSAYDAAAHGRATSTSPNETAFTKAHPDTAPWLPVDAASITVVQSTREANTITIGYESATEPEGCETVTRTSAPTMDIDADVDVYAIDSVLRCDRWAVAHDGDRWVAWTPASEATQP
ncbi:MULTISPECIES: hypothetical protein [unclassified Microbacterium]|uniref:hypothetical protein n=1 Tax=unclassified Microbacterium TaxID=2609290 RepID=UPI00386ADC0E